MRIALINGMTIENIIEADDLSFAETLGYDLAIPCPDGAHLRDAWIDGALVHTEPEQPEPPAPPRHITSLAFRNRFTTAENVTIEIACLDDPTATMQQRAQSASLRVMQRQVSEATYIDLDRADTRAGVQQLEAAGILAAGRALEILDAPVQLIEAFSG